MKNDDNSFSLPNSFLEKDEECVLVTSPLPLHNTTNITGLQTQEVNCEIGGTGVEDDAIVGTDQAINFKTRGRPRGSKNKAKGVVQEMSGMKLEAHEIPPGTDVINWVVQLAQCKQLCVTVVSGSGLISLVDLNYGKSNLPPVTISGPLTLTSFSGAFLTCSSSPHSRKFFTASLKRFDQQVFGGAVAGRMIASSPVVLMITTFNNPKIYELGN